MRFLPWLAGVLGVGSLIVAVLVAKHPDWAPSWGVAATWVAISAAAFGTGIAARNLHHAQTSSRIDRAIAQRRLAIAAFNEYLKVIDKLYPTFLVEAPKYEHLLPFPANARYQRSDGGGVTAQSELTSMMNAIDAAINSTIASHYIPTFGAVQGTPLKSKLDQVEQDLESILRATEKLRKDAELLEPIADDARTLVACFNRLSQRKTETIEFLHNRGMTLEDSAISKDLNS